MVSGTGLRPIRGSDRWRRVYRAAVSGRDDRHGDGSGLSLHQVSGRERGSRNGVGPEPHLSADQTPVVDAAVPHPDMFGQRFYRLIQNMCVVDDFACHDVARTRQGGQGFSQPELVQDVGGCP